MPLNVQRPLGRDLDATTAVSLFQAAGVDSQSIRTVRPWSVIPTALRDESTYGWVLTILGKRGDTSAHLQVVGLSVSAAFL